MREVDFIKIIKIAIGSALAIIIAQSIGLAYSTAAGIITLLSIQNTKKQTIFVAIKRLISFVTALIIVIITFSILGYTPISFGVFLLIFVFVSYRFKLEDGISLNAVLMTHILVEKSMSLSWMINEGLLLFIGSGIGILLNLYIPSKKKEIVKFQRNVEEKMKYIIGNMTSGIIENDKDIVLQFKSLERTLKEASNKAYENMNNTFIGDTRYYIDYIDMRRNQTMVLKKIYDNIRLLSSIPPQFNPIRALIQEISSTYHEYNNVEDLIIQVGNLRKNMKEEQLPTLREEFENRAILFVVLSDFENFLQLKAEFVKNLTNEQIKNYWNDAEKYQVKLTK